MKTSSFHIELHGFDSNVAGVFQDEIMRRISEGQVRASVEIVDGKCRDSNTQLPCLVIIINRDIQERLDPAIQAVRDTLPLFNIVEDVSVYVRDVVRIQ